MKAIFWIALVSMAVFAMGSGYLMETEIMLNLQFLGVGAANFEAPISNPTIDISIEKIDGFDSMGNPLIKNKIRSCSFHFPDTDPGGVDALNGPGVKVICKLLDHDGNVIAEGELCGPFVASENNIIPITDLAFDFADFVFNIGDVRIILVGPTTTSGTCV